MGRGDLSDAERAMIGPLLPSERGHWARPAGDNRQHQLSRPCLTQWAEKGAVAQAFGQSCGGKTHKIHARSDNQGRPMASSLSAEKPRTLPLPMT